MSVLQGNFNNLITSMQDVAMQDFGDPTYNMNGALAHTIKNIKRVDAGIKDINTSFKQFNKGFNSSGVSFGGADYTGGSSNTGGGGSKSKKSPSSSEKAKQTEKDVADLKKMTNAYHDVERALDLVNHKLKINKSLQEGATEKQKLKYMKDEVALYKEKQSLLNKEIKLYEKEQASLKKTLLKNDKSFKFDKSGNITNYNDIMKAWVKKANSLTGKAKEKYIEQVKQMQEYVERYEDITHETLYGLKEDWKDLNNSIKEVLEEQNRIIMDAKQKAYDDVVWQVDTQQGNYFEYKLKLLDEDDVQGKVEIMNTQLQNQNKILQASRKYLEDLYAMGLKPTDAGYEDWIERLKEAEQEFHNQRMEFESMKDSLEDLVKNQMTEYINQLKEIEQIEMDKRHQQEKIDLEKKYFDTALAEYNKYKESKIKSLNEEIEAIKKKLEVEKGNEALLDILKAKQLELNELQNEQYEKITSWYELEEKMHNANIDAIDKELKALEEKNKLEEENEERLKRQNELIEIQQRMQNIKKNKNIRELTKNDKGEFNWDYTYDRKALADANKEYKEKQEDLAKWEKDLELEKYKEKLNQQKEYEQEALALLKAQYDKALALLEEKQTKESEVMDKKYEDMLEDTDKYLEDMLTKYDGSWTKIIEVLGLKLEEGNLKLDSFAQTTIATIDNLSAYIDGLYSKLEGLQNIDISSKISEGFTNPVVPNLPVVNSLSKTTSTTSNTYHVNANFPNATSSDEIEKALTSIGDNTTQYVGRR